MYFGSMCTNIDHVYCHMSFHYCHVYYMY